MKFSDEQARYLAKFIAKNMIARTDVKASQLPRGQGAYVRNDSKWTMTDLMAHVKGEETYGHYLLDQDSNVKIIAFDIDLAQTGWYVPFSPEDLLRYIEDPDLMNDEQFIEFNPREAWADRKHPARPWLKHQMRELADRFASAMQVSGIKTFATYSGSKGVHVYGILGERTPAADARILAHGIMDFVASDLVYQTIHNVGGTQVIEYHEYEVAASKGKSFYYLKCDTASRYRSFDNFSIEVFPKQDHIEPNRLGNLMRLPFGKNLKNPKDPTFVIDQCAASSSLVPITDFDTLKTRLESGEPYGSFDVWGKYTNSTDATA